MLQRTKKSLYWLLINQKNQQIFSLRICPVFNLFYNL